MMYYAMLAAAAVLFASQFLFNQKFETECGSSFASSMAFSLYGGIGGFIVLFAINGFKFDFSWFSLAMAVCCAVVGILYTIASVKSFEEVNLSAYSVFAMLGGMLLPSVYGIIFRSEEITPLKILCYVLIIAALLFTIDFKQKSGKKIYYAAVFVLNGLTGVISVIHQSNTVYTIVDSFSYLMMSRAVQALLCLPFCITEYKTVKNITTKKSLCYAFGFAVFCGIGNLLTLISLKYLPASVQYPIITGGVMFISLLISVLRKENVTRKNVVSTIIAFLSTILIAI